MRAIKLLPNEISPLNASIPRLLKRLTTMILLAVSKKRRKARLQCNQLATLRNNRGEVR